MLNCRAVQGSWILVNVWKALSTEPMICVIYMCAYYCYEMNALVLGEGGHAQAIRAWKFSTSSGSQTLPRSGGKVSNLGYCYCTYKGGIKKKIHFSKISPDCPRKKTFSLCGHDWEHM